MAVSRDFDNPRLPWYEYTMQTITETLKNAIRESGLSDRNLGMQTGVNRQSIGRFRSGQTSLTLQQAEQLAKFFGLELRCTDQQRLRKGSR